MTLDMFLSDLRERQIHLRADGDSLHCDAPPDVLTPDLLQQIAQRKADVLAFLRRSAMNQRQVEAIAPSDRTQPLPLSFAQERFWFIDRFIEEKAVYNVPLGLALDGPLDPVALSAALSIVVARHEALRAAFHGSGNGVIQTIGPAYAVELPHEDLLALVPAQREQRLRTLAVEELQRPFDLGAGRLLRARLVVMAADHHVLLITIHHIACDAWSLNLLVDDLREAYRDGAIARPSPSLQYADFAAWQRSHAGGARDSELLARYQARLQGSATGTMVASDRPRPAIQSYRGACHRVTLPDAVLVPLRELASSENASLFMVLLAAVKLLLFRYTRHDDISVGVPIIGRNRPELQDVVGCFLNTLVMRTRLYGGMSGRELLRAVREICLEGYELGEVPFEKLVEALQLHRDLSYNPLFQVMFFLQSEPVAEVCQDGLCWRKIDVENETAKFDLSFEIDETKDGAILLLRYNRDLFDAATIERMAHHYQVLLAALGTWPESAIGTATLLTAAEHASLHAWNAVGLAPHGVSCVHALFETQARRTPDALALICGERRLNYRELNEGANRIAHSLIVEGLQPGQLVGIYCQRSVEMMQGMLAVWKAGGAYVPIDPTYPPERVAFILDDADVAVVLMEEALLASMPSTSARRLLLDDTTALQAVSNIDPGLRMGSGDLSHIIYTSGSTGRPKGAMIEHGSVLALLQWAQRTYRVEDLAHVLASTSICFDLSVFELFAPMVHGGCVHLVENVLHLPQHASRDQVTLINTVPSALAQLLHSGALPPGVRVLNLAGEPLQRSLVDLAYRQPQVQAVYNLYGPSEDTTYSTWVRVPPDTDEAPTIGVPLPGKQVHILDPDLQPVPVGVLGELYMGGAGLARGYLNRAELTAERFIAHPATGERLYRTGDLGRYQVDGQIIYAGRTDFQVKVRGFRIELGEIETVLRSHSRIADAIVLARRDHAGDPMLAAYFVTKSDGIDIAVLRAYLKARLPGFMLPASMTLLDAMPLTLNGKIDRNALPPPEPVRHEAKTLPARTALEKDIATIWQDLLGHPRIGVNDNFFEVGGHSLLVLQMHTRITTLVGRNLPIIELFRYPTIRSLAEFLNAVELTSDSFNHLKDRMNKRQAMLAQRRNIAFGEQDLMP